MGDVLLQVVLHAQIANENKEFNIDDVAHDLCEKLIHRHPHVFGETKVKSSDDVVKNWDKLKSEEKSYRKSAMNWLSKKVMSLLPVKKNDDAPSVTEIMAMAENSVKAGKIDSMEKSLMYSSSQINDLKAEDVMIPKNKIVAVKSNVSVSELLRIFKTHLYSRIPVYSTTIDEIIGIFNIKECLKLKPDEEENFDIRNYMIKPIYVPGNVTIGSLMEQMKSTRIHMAVVVSEYGITDGIVTLENILERIIGLIGDEYDDESEDMLITMNNKGTKELEVDGTISLQDLSKELSIDIPSAKHKVNTLNGYITEEKGDFVAVGEEFIIENYIFKVLSIKGRCADKIRITKKNG